MGMFAIHHPWVFTFGLLGNIISFMVYLAPLPTFYRICKKKTTDGFESVPYIVAMFSAMLWMYYAFLKSDAYLLITINSIGCVIETIYITLFLAYAPKTARIKTVKMILILNLGVYSLILLLTLLLVKGPVLRTQTVGWVCVVVSVSVFAAPLSVMRMVLRTKSVEFLPFPLSLSLTINAVIWFTYGILLKDICIALPNTLGFLFGVVQMVVYIIYKDNHKGKGDLEGKMAEEQQTVHVLNLNHSIIEISDLPESCNRNESDLEEAQKHVQKTMETSTLTGEDNVQICACQA